MKLRFSIHYRTEWGQQMVVCVSYCAADGVERHVQLPMTTQNGDQWTGETVVLESRRSPIMSFTYYYIVADADGKELRREWTMMHRDYAFDSTKTFIFNDQWHDMPLNTHLYSAAYQVTTNFQSIGGKGGEQQGDKKGAKKLPLFRKTLLFRVSAPQLTDEQRKILRLALAEGAVGPTDLVRAYGGSNPTWSRRLKALEEAGLLEKGSQKRCRHE